MWTAYAEYLVLGKTGKVRQEVYRHGSIRLYLILLRPHLFGWLVRGADQAEAQDCKTLGAALRSIAQNSTLRTCITGASLVL